MYLTLDSPRAGGMAPCLGEPCTLPAISCGGLAIRILSNCPPLCCPYCSGWKKKNKTTFLDFCTGNYMNANYFPKFFIQTRFGRQECRRDSFPMTFTFSVGTHAHRRFPCTVVWPLVHCVLDFRSSLEAMSPASWPPDPQITNMTCDLEFNCSHGGLLIPLPSWVFQES